MQQFDKQIMTYQGFNIKLKITRLLGLQYCLIWCTYYARRRFWKTSISRSKASLMLVLLG